MKDMSAADAQFGHRGPQRLRQALRRHAPRARRQPCQPPSTQASHRRRVAIAAWSPRHWRRPRRRGRRPAQPGSSTSRAEAVGLADDLRRCPRPPAARRRRRSAPGRSDHAGQAEDQVVGGGRASCGGHSPARPAGRGGRRLAGGPGGPARAISAGSPAARASASPSTGAELEAMAGEARHHAGARRDGSTTKRSPASTS